MIRRTQLASRVAALLAAMSLLAVVPALPAAALSPTTCQVTDTESKVVKPSLQAAVDAAKRGHHLTVRGVCHGPTVIKKSITITGIRPAGAARPTLDGDAAGSVISTRTGIAVTIRKLRITDGSGTACGPVCTDGGAIYNHATLLLDSVRIDHNTASNVAFAIYNDAAPITFSGTTSVDHNSGTFSGIYNLGTLTFRDSASFHDNTSTLGSGIDNGGTIILRGSASFHHNAGASGAAIGNGGTVTLRDNASIHDNTASDVGGGIANYGIVMLAGSAAISHNTAATKGGGVYNTGTLDPGACGTSIHDNSPDDCAS
ncbi:MAG: hypothetical protein U0869_26630 [Chloroflexota bacterium]